MLLLCWGYVYVDNVFFVFQLREFFVEKIIVCLRDEIWVQRVDRFRQVKVSVEENFICVISEQHGDSVVLLNYAQ